jgi:hypothetical protein
MILHPEIRPRIGPGAHELELLQTFEYDTVEHVVQREVHHLEVTGPRVTLPGTELFSVSPPPNAEGAFAGRLAQVALRRRTLPWERSRPRASGPPWMALVILTDEEATYLPQVPVAEAFTTGVAAGLDGLSEGPAHCDALEVLDAVVERTFPTIDEVSALCHGRQVSVGDTEYADEDGFVSVVICNRLPQPGTRYAAYLISLEGQHAELPENPEVAEEAGPAWVFDIILKAEVREQLVVDWHRNHDTFVRPDLAGAAGRVEDSRGLEGGHTVLPSMLDGMVAGVTRRADEGIREATGADARVGRAGPAVSTSQPASVAAAGMVSHAVDHALIAELIALPRVRTLRFPVLARWEFACTEEDRDFRAYMRGVDIGLIGEDLQEAPGDLRPLRATATGHLPLTHVDRSGREGRSWYRGPFSPVKITRGDTVPFHHADQARTLVPDEEGVTEDLGYAAAFELGRLLGMADLSFVSGMRRMVAAGFRQPMQVVAEDRFRDLLELPRQDLAWLQELSRMLTVELLLSDRIGPDLTPGFGTILPKHELQALDLEPELAGLAAGLDIPLSAVEAALGATITGERTRPPVAERDVLDFESLAGGRIEAVQDLTGQLSIEVAGRLHELAAGDKLLVDAGREGLLGGRGDALGGGLRDAIEVLGAVGGRAASLGRGDAFSDAILAGRIEVTDGPSPEDPTGARVGDTVRLPATELDRIGRVLGGRR